MTSDESTRIATLTTGAVRESANKVTLQIREAVRTAEQKTNELRAEAEQLIEEFEQRTGALADQINEHVLMCQTTIDKFKAREFPAISLVEAVKPNGAKAAVGRPVDLDEASTPRPKFDETYDPHERDPLPPRRGYITHGPSGE